MHMLPVKQTEAIISTYAADVSGVCSALFELGGMTVMHDASGCNSTYNTHDEPRWYDIDSLVFISALSELEAIMGDDEKLIGDIIDAASELSPRFIAIAGTPIPMMTGCDIPAIAADIERRTGIPAFGFQTNGMHSYVCGAGTALAAYAGRFVRRGLRRTEKTVNILGATPLDFSVNGAVRSMRLRLEEAGWRILSVWAMDSAPEELERAGEASVNLVASSVGLDAAMRLREMFKTPYVCGAPFGDEFSERVTEALALSAQDGKNRSAFDFLTPEGADTVIIGESVMSRSLAAGISLKYGVKARVVCPLECKSGILSAGDCAAASEVDTAAAIKSAGHIIADPLYRPIAPENAKFHDLPHEAFSGRLFRKKIPNLVESI